MTYFADLAPCTYFDVDAPLVAVGWLDEAHPFPSGVVDEGFYLALADVASRSYQPALFEGYHRCQWCPENDVTQHDHIVGECRLKLGNFNIFVPAGDRVYAAPSLIVHYIAIHLYVPPAEFQRAVEACAQLDQAAYVQALFELGIYGGLE